METWRSHNARGEDAGAIRTTLETGAIRTTPETSAVSVVGVLWGQNTGCFSCQYQFQFLLTWKLLYLA